MTTVVGAKDAMRHPGPSGPSPCTNAPRGRRRGTTSTTGATPTPGVRTRLASCPEQPVTYFPLPDEFYADPKFIGASDAAVALWARAASWSAHHLTDGHVPSATLLVLQQRDDQAAAELVERRVWRRARGGFQFVDWPKLASKDHVEAKRDAARARQQKARRSKGVASRRDTRVTNGVTHKGSHTGSHGTQSSPSLPSGERWTADAVHGGQDFPGDGSGSARAAAQARALAITNCTTCDERGYADGRLCHHDPKQAEVNANGVAKAWAVLGGKPHPEGGSDD